MRGATITVVNAKGQPVEGAVVRLWAVRGWYLMDLPDGRKLKHSRGTSSWRESDWGPEQKVATNIDGVATVIYPRLAKEREPTGWLTCEVSHPDYCRLTNVKVDVVNALQPIVLQRGVTLHVTAYTNNEAESLPHLAGFISGPARYDWQQTDGDRLISAPILPARKWLRVVHLADDEQMYFSRPVEWTGQVGQVTQLHVQVHRGTRVVGRLDDSVPRPVVNGRVMAKVIRPGPRGYASRLTWSEVADIDPDGTFVFESLPRGERLQVVAICDGHVSKTPTAQECEEFARYILIGGHVGRSLRKAPQVFSLVGDQTEFTVPMEPTGSCQVRVVDQSGKPVAGAKVRMGPNNIFYNGGSQLMGIGRSDGKFVRAERRTPGQNLTDFATEALDFSAVTDTDGVAVVKNIHDRNRHLVSVEHARYEVPIQRQGSLENRYVVVSVRSGEMSKLTVKVQEKGTEFLGE